MKVYVGHVVPLMREEGKQEWVTEAALREFQDYLELLSKYVNGVLNLFKDLDDTDRAELIADFIVVFYKYPLIASPTPPGVESYVLPQELFWIWLLTRRKHEKEWREVDKALANRELQLKLLRGFLRDKLLDFFKEGAVIESKLKQISYEVFIRVPSDSRPANNVSKLIPHLLASSAIAASSYLTKALKTGKRIDNKLRLELAILRLACLLHDIGKPSVWIKDNSSHAEESACLTVKILNGLREDIKEAVRRLIAHHHSLSKKLGKIKVCEYEIDLDDLIEALRAGDWWSSRIDRLSEICADKISSVLEDKRFNKRFLVESGAEAWKYWKNISEETLRKASEEAAKYLYFKGWLDLLKEKRVAKEDVRLIGFDIRRIQSYISREKLKVLMAASYAVDLFIAYCLPRALVEHYVFPENIIYAGGGFLIAIASTEIPSDLGQVIERAKEILDLTLEAVYADAPLLHPWSASVNTLASRLSAKKSLLKQTIQSLELGIEYSCEICGSRPAVAEEKYMKVCEDCRSLLYLGDNIYFSFKIKPFENNRLKWDKIRDHVLEWLSGMPVEKAERGEAYNIAVVKADGNLMGYFMSKATSLCDSIERSIRIDYGVKKGIYELYNILSKIEGSEENICRVYVGLTYAGGDDLMAIWPAWLAIPASLIISYWFWRTLGGTRQLSAGVVSGKIKYNIWALRESAEELLSWCKSALREKFTGDVEEDEQRLFNSAAFISYYYTDTQQVLPAHIDSLKDYTKQGVKSLSWQPYFLPVKINNKQPLIESNFIEILNTLCKRKSGEPLEEYLSRLLKEFYEEFTKGGVRAKYVRDITREVYDVASSYEIAEKHPPLVISAYLFNRWSEGDEDARKDIYREMISLISRKNFEKIIPLFDIFMLAKFAMGGKK